MSLPDLPREIIAAIIRIALDAAAVPSAILCVSKLFRDLGIAYLYTHLQFTSARQLHQFACSEAPHPPIAPRSLTVDLTGRAQYDVLPQLRGVLVKCRRLAVAEHGEERDVELKRLHLRMYSYAMGSTVEALEQGLQAVSPDAFEWTGPDPDHHFSIAIVPSVACCLFKQFSSWSIREITVTNISFTTGSDREGRVPPLMEDVPSLRFLYIGQATFLHAQAIAGMFCQGRMARLEKVRLVDAYSESIWGPRLRKSDIEKAALILSTQEQMAVIARVKRVVTCEKKTERIMGGDRVEGTHILD